MTEQIEIDFQAALKRAEILLEASGRLYRITGVNLENVYQYTRQGWQGENAELYRKKCTDLSVEIAGTAKAMKAVALSIRTATEVMYRAEMQALQLATTNSHS
ncbi:MAG: hypothetical protein Q4G60_12515 [bacterium]|nr:hypothetical protein [bacterium]